MPSPLGLEMERAVRGFTLIELMVTLAIMATLAMVAMPMIEITMKRHKEQELRRSLMQIRDGLDAYKRAVEQGYIAVEAGESGYPERLEDLVEGVSNQRSPNKEKLYFLRRLPRDPFYQDSSVPASQTWGKRSYASPPDDPREGVDVFDVYSLAVGVGLNQIPYREW